MAPLKRPRWLQDGSLVLLDRFLSALVFRFDFRSFSVPFGVVLGCPNGPLKVTEKRAARPLGGSRDSLGSVLMRFLVRLVVWDRFCALFGPSWHHFGLQVVPFLAFLGPVLGSWVPFFLALVFLFWRCSYLFRLEKMQPVYCLHAYMSHVCFVFFLAYSLLFCRCCCIAIFLYWQSLFLFPWANLQHNVLH